MAEKNNILTSDHLTSFFFYLSILFFIIGFNFSDTPLNGGWYQQFMPDMGERQITDITFLDSLTGYAVTNNLSAGDTGYILKTTNSGDNWNFSFTINRGYTAIDFINLNTGYACGGSGGGTTYLCRTTNAGLNWSLVSSPSAAKWKGMSVLSYDTLWLVDDDGLTGGVFLTTNGGVNWTHQLNIGSNNPDRIYMYNARIGFAARSSGHSLYRTTNSGQNWTLIDFNEGFNDMFFVDSLTGWYARGFVKKTTNGGLNWITQTLPFGGNILGNGASKFLNKNNDSIWAVGEQIYINGYKGILFRTTNSGSNWLFQLPDTSIYINRYLFGQFVTKNIAWAYSFNPTGIHSTTGGNDTFFTSITQVSTSVPKEFILFQNYPNPFNPSTIIRFQILRLSDIRLVVYDVTGKEITILTDKKYKTGSYEVTFNGKSYSTGIYFYSLIVDGKLIDTKKMILLK
jgi:photosystem II stability/assembly factor-like uncharacterized protein